MNIQIMSRAEISKFAMQNRSDSYAVISIRDVDSTAPVLARGGNGIDAVLSLAFDDVEEGEKNCITAQDAKKIAAFVNRIRKSYANLIVHCEFGQSRSAGVAAAVSATVNGDDAWVFEDGRYCVNPACYKKTLRAFPPRSRRRGAGIFGKRDTEDG